MRWVISWTDGLIYILMLGLFAWGWVFRKTNEWHLIRNRILKRPRYLVVFLVLMVYGIVGFLDSIHFKDKNQYEPQSVIDVLFSPRDHQFEKTYSAPFATHAYVPEMIKNEEGVPQEVFPKLKYAGQHLNHIQDKWFDVFVRIATGIGLGLIVILLLFGLSVWFKRIRSATIKHAPYPSSSAARWTFWVTLSIIFCLMGSIAMLIKEYHILGTDKIGRDVFYIAVKSIRTGLVIGTVTLLVAVPFALFLGMWAGYFGGRLDDAIQYTYTTLSSIPGILLIAAAMLSFQVLVESDSDLRLLILCIILGVTSWTTLCRLLRGETLKLRESDFVQSAITLGTRSLNIINRHIMPNLMHIVIITVVLDFSGLVLAEAILSYVGVGVDPTSYSWGNMINAARLEMARDPIVWWSLLGALALMFTLVFSANVFAEALQEALNPRRGE